MKNKIFNDLIVLAEEKKVKKGGSLKSVLQLIESLSSFQEELENCIASQEMAQNKEKIQSFMPNIEAMYDALFDIARTGVKSMRQEMAVNSGEVEEPVLEPTPEPIEPMLEPKQETYEDAGLQKPTPPSM